MLVDTHISLLAELAGGAPLSGEALAQRLGLTRARVSQLVSELNTCGAAIASSRSGYRAAFPDTMLNARNCAAGISPDWQIKIAPTIASTNAALTQGGAAHGSVQLAEWQSGGRGRRGRAWSGAPGGSILMSVGWQFAGGAATLAGLSLAVGVAIANALATCGAEDVKLKWPNDIYWHGQKLGGVLIELAGDALGPTNAVIGIGLNVHLPAAARADIEQAVTDLSAVAPMVVWDRNALVRALLASLHETLTAFAETGFAPFAPQWRARDAFAGKPVIARLPDGKVMEAERADIDEAGALVLKRDKEMLRFLSAEISLQIKKR
jgi:BirA family transcriptional regulator, biotin operon repressor / biotin---[acetyl-CoA-carboxylase] ligase